MKPIENESPKLRFNVGDTVRYMNTDVVFKIVSLIPCKDARCPSKHDGECDGFDIVDPSNLSLRWHPCPGQFRKVKT